MSTSRPVRRGVLGAAAALAVLALTGCGAIQPGVAVEVGDESISTSRLDDVTSDFCEAISPQLDGQAQTIPNGYLRGGIAGTLAMRSIADQIAADYGVEASSDQYQQAVDQTRQGITGLPEDLQDSVFEVDTAPAYVEAVQAAVGEVLLDGDGEYEDFVNAGAEEFETWISGHDVEFDPSLNTSVADGTITTQDDAVSFAVSEQAKAALEEQPNAALARQLPASHRCGR